MVKPRKPKPARVVATPSLRTAMVRITPEVTVSKLDLPLGPIPSKPGSRLKGPKK